MQTSEFETQVAQSWLNTSHNSLKLVIGNKNYSSWSMRPWVAMKAFNIPFDEIRVLLDQQDTWLML